MDPLEPPDGWVRKAAAAELLQVSTKTLEEWGKAGRLELRPHKPPRGPGYSIVRLDDVRRLQTERAIAPTAIALPAANNGHGQALEAPRDVEALRSLLLLLGGRFSEPSEKPVYVNRDTALAIAGVSADELRKAVDAGEVKLRGRRYRRADLEAL